MKASTSAATGATPETAGEETAFPAARTLAGATVLLALPALRRNLAVYDALYIVSALLRAGARPIVAAQRGPLISDLRFLGCEFIELPGRSEGTMAMARQARRLAAWAATARIDVIHAYGEFAARLALRAARSRPKLVVTLEDGARAIARRGYSLALARADVVIAQSSRATAPLVAAALVARDRVAIIPRITDTEIYTPGAVPPEKAAALRNSWKIKPGERIVLAPGVVAPEHGQADLVDAARILRHGGLRNVVFAVPGDRRGERRHFRALAQYAAAAGVDDMFCLGAPPADIATLLGTADFVVAPNASAPWAAQIVAEAQAMARPVLVADDALGELIMAPPRLPDDLRTGWRFRPNDPPHLARTLKTALDLDERACAEIGKRARRFAVMQFSPASVAAMTLAVYTCVLEGDR